MFDRLSRSFTLVRQSWDLLLEDRKLLLFPVASGMSSTLLVASFVGPAILSIVRRGSEHFEAPPYWYALAFVLYMLLFFVTFYFNTAIMCCTALRLDGHQPTLRDGIRGANARAIDLLAWSALAATVGVILRTIESRLGFIGRIVAGLIGAAWSAVTYFVVPVLVFERAGAGDAVRRSTDLLKHAWGESLAVNVGTSIAFRYLSLLGVVPIVALLYVGGRLEQPALMVGGFLLALFYWLFLAVVSSAIASIYHVVLYRYASTGLPPRGFDVSLLSSQFRPR